MMLQHRHKVQHDHFVRRSRTVDRMSVNIAIARTFARKKKSIPLHALWNLLNEKVCVWLDRVDELPRISSYLRTLPSDLCPLWWW